MQESNTSLVNQVTFNKNINEIYQKSIRIGDSWKLIHLNEDTDIFYLEKSEQKFMANLSDIYTFIYHVIYSEAFSVPVLFLNAYKSNGRVLNYDEIYSYFHLDRDLTYKENGNLLILTQTEHPFLAKPFYFLHPCKTRDWMKATQFTKASSSSNFTLKWLSFVLASLGIQFDLKYALEIEKL